ncbi:hypothetical protein NMG60_11020306 [Bertholletia excelsa]
MMMEGETNTEEIIVEASEEDPKDRVQIVKGRRTKRPRPHSPFNSFSMAADHFRASPPPTSGSSATVEEEEELEDIANCLILLAQGQSRYQSNNYNYNVNDNNYTTGKRLYQCKTCNRTFSSFQALGGHRASHRKPKTEERGPSTRTLYNSDDEEEQLVKTYVHSHSYPSLQLGNNIRPNLSSKVHECAICGAEFTSGQALGGHMRRHRALTGATTGTASPLSPSNKYESIDHHQEAKRPRTVLSLDLDLNLPAPDDESKLKQQQQQQKQSPLVLSTAPALVDCHY